MHRAQILPGGVAFVAVCTVGVACNDDLPSHMVFLKLLDVDVSAMMGTTPLAGFAVRPYQQSDDRPPDDGSGETLSDEKGGVGLRLGEFDYNLQIHEPDRMDASAWVRVVGPLDLTTQPIIVPSRIFDGTRDFCRDSLRMVGSRALGDEAPDNGLDDDGDGVVDERLGTAWIRVYKTAGPMLADDTLTITAEQAGADDVCEGADVIDAVTAAGDGWFIDIYDDATVTVDAPGHKDCVVWSSGRDDHRTDYRVTLNGESFVVSPGPCGKGGLTIVYL